MPNKRTLPKSDKPLLVITGKYQNGKSTFLNCLLGGYYAVEGQGLITTKYNAKYFFGDCKTMQIVSPGRRTREINFQPLLSETFSPVNSLADYDKNSLLEISAYSPILESFDLLDSPGCGANDEDDSVAETALSMADFVVFVVQKEISDTEISFIKKIVEAGKHFSVILNCQNDLAPDSRQAQTIIKTIYSKMRNQDVLGNYVMLSEKYPVYSVNLLWAQCALGYLEPDIYKQKLRKVCNYLDAKYVSPIDLLKISNFLSVRDKLKNIVGTFFDYTPHSDLHLLKKVADNWTMELMRIWEN